MTVIDHINAANGKTLFSFEILPPLKGKSIDSLFAGIDPLLEFDPSFINVTYHREEFIYKKREHGYLEKIAIRKRPGTVGICATIKHRYNIETVPHLTCGGFSKKDTEDALIDLNYLGIHNILALRGDPIKTESTFVPDEDGNAYAVDLVEQVSRMNKGKFLNDEVENDHKSKFCIGVAGYPEKHYESMNLTTDLTHLKAKIDAGAEYIVTQMFFDNDKFFEFERRCREIGINVPIIPGLKPITTEKHIQFIPKTFSVDFPEALSKELMKCKDKEAVKEVGIEWCAEQSKGLKAHGVPSLHYYTMGKSAAVKRIASAVF